MNMRTNYYITSLEYDIINFTAKTEIISFEEIKTLFPKRSPITLKKSIAKLCRNGYLHRLKKGLYYSTPDKRFIISDPLTIPQLIYPGYIAFSSALRFHNLIEYEPFIIYSATRTKSRTIPLGEYTFRYISMGTRATGATNIKGTWVSTIEKTFFDCFYKPQYAGGYEVITKALYEQKYINWDIFLNYIDEFASNSLRQRIGYILDLLKDKSKMKIPGRIIDQLQPEEEAYIWLLPSGPRKGNRIKKWKIFDNVGQNRILEWWYNG